MPGKPLGMSKDMTLPDSPDSNEATGQANREVSGIGGESNSLNFFLVGQRYHVFSVDIPQADSSICAA
jgi:hypothetical protein